MPVGVVVEFVEDPHYAVLNGDRPPVVPAIARQPVPHVCGDGLVVPGEGTQEVPAYMLRTPHRMLRILSLTLVPRARRRVPLVTMPISWLSSSTTGAPVKPCVDSSAAASFADMSGRTQVTGLDMTSSARMISSWSVHTGRLEETAGRIPLSLPFPPHPCVFWSRRSLPVEAGDRSGTSS